MPKRNAASGFRAHSGWAAVVALAGPSRSPAVIDRRHIELAEPGIPRPVQPYHQTQHLDLKEAEEVVRNSADQAGRLARQSLLGDIANLHVTGPEVVGCSIITGSGRPATSLAATLASHTLIHMAEGKLFRDALIQASKHCGLPILEVREQELYAQAAVKLGFARDKVRRRLNELGSALGPGWTQGQKIAALAAWLALEALSN